MFQDLGATIQLHPNYLRYRDEEDIRRREKYRKISPNRKYSGPYSRDTSSAHET